MEILCRRRWNKISKIIIFLHHPQGNNEQNERVCIQFLLLINQFISKSLGMSEKERKIYTDIHKFRW